MRQLAAAALLGLAACGSTECDRVADAYAKAIADARRCDPADRAACSRLERASIGPGSNACDLVAVSPGRCEEIEAIYGEFVGDGCPLGPLPPCPLVPASAFACRAVAGAALCVRVDG